MSHSRAAGSLKCADCSLQQKQCYWVRTRDKNTILHAAICRVLTVYNALSGAVKHSTAAAASLKRLRTEAVTAVCIACYRQCMTPHTDSLHALQSSCSFVKAKQ